MSVFTFSLDYRENTAALERAILKQFGQYFTNVLRKAKDNIQIRLIQAFNLAMRAAPEAVSLRDGRLRGELGVLNPDRAFDLIVAALLNAMQVVITPPKVVGNNYASEPSLEIRMLATDLHELEAVMEAVSFVSEHAKVTVDWLRWLLTSGDTVMVADYRFVPGHFGRTWRGHMIKHGSWSVPREFAGTVEHNWLTKSLDAIVGSEVEKIIGEELQRAFQ